MDFRLQGFGALGVSGSGFQVLEIKALGRFGFRGLSVSNQVAGFRASEV